ETGVYASSLLGSTTVLSRTEVDAPGTKNDAERVSESRRDLRQAPELRRMVKYRQGIAIVDTADPILFRFRRPADDGDVAVASKRALLPAPSLAEAVAAMNEIRAKEKRRIEEVQAVGAASVANETDHSAAIVEKKSTDESDDATDEKALRK